MAKLTLSDITSGYAAPAKYNANNTLIEAALENTLSRDGTDPNQMNAVLDMNSNLIINLGEPVSSNDAARLQDVQNMVDGGPSTANLITVTDVGGYYDTDTVEGNLQEIGVALRETWWIEYQDVPTRTGNTTFTVPTDLTARYDVGRRVRLVGATTNTATITASSFSSVTTVTVLMDSGNVPLSLTSVQLGVPQDNGSIQPYYKPTASEIALSATIRQFNYPEGNAYRYLTDTQLADVIAYTGSVNVNSELQKAMDVAFKSQVDCVFPSGRYLVTGLVMPGTSVDRDMSFKLVGAGCGESFAIAGQSGGTILYSTTNAPILSYVQDVASTGNGEADISRIRFHATNVNTTNYVISLEAFYATSEFHHNVVFNDGTGGGLFIGLANTIEIHHNQIFNGDFLTSSLGASRTGVGIKIVQDIDTGLTTLRKNTSRGWLTAYELGDGTHKHFSNKIEDCECSVVRNGIILNSGVERCVVNANYMEGIDGGTAVLDSGNYNVITNNLIFPGFGTGIDMSSTTTYGTICRDNVVSCGSVTDSKLIKLGGGSKGKTCTGNALVFGGSGGSVAGVVGITLTGTRPFFEMGNNHFDPSAAWTGGAGTAKYSDSTSGGATGYSKVDSANLEFPIMRNGVVTSGRGSTLGDSSVSSNVLTLPKLQTHALTLTGAATINSITVTGGTDDAIRVTIISTNANPTFADTASINMVGGAAFTPGANGGFIEFEIRSTGIAFELGRGSY